MKPSLPTETAERGRNLVMGFVREISDTIGPPKSPICTIEISVFNHGPALGIRDNGHATVYLGPHALKHEAAFVANLAHESVHLHQWTRGYASGLEEGFAVAFELATVEAEFGLRVRWNFEKHMPRSYTQALRDYSHLVTLEPDGLRILIDLYGRLSGLTSRQIRYAIPKIGWWRSYRLARRIPMR